ncbi:MAG TPA: L-rhamnose mutarotase [Chitinophagaceae bacterium]|nr:L-rhamnose mutarotase [Chitinophagaceae bacterium]
MSRYCLTVDLKDDPALIQQYEDYHRKVWPEILQSLTDSGILSMEIYRLRTRMFMIIETTDDFSFEKKSGMDLANPKVQEWEKLMSQFQQALPWEKPDDPWKWKLMEKVFDFDGSK